MERSTRQRRAVQESLAGSGRTLSPTEILELARQDAPGLNLSTVYRQIKALESDGEVVKVELPGQPSRFEIRCNHPEGDHHDHADVKAEVAARMPHHHHHFHCLHCNAVVPIHGCPGTMQELAPGGYQVESHDLVLYGRCADCARQEAT